MEKSLGQHPLVRRVEDFLARQLTCGDSILVGVSGGPDSVALARILGGLAPRLGLDMALAHVNHGYRGKAAHRDEAFTRELARELGLAFHVHGVDVAALAREKRMSIEEAGRQVRYDFFNTLVAREGYTHIATGHNRDDNAEQVLMNLLRGAGTRGLAGIPPVQENLCFCPIIRPLIRTAKADILSFLEGIDQAYMEDATNADPAFRRNALRHQLIPLLEEKYNPKIKQALDRLSRIMAREDEFLAREAQAGLDACLREEGPEMISLSLGNLSCYHGALIPRILRLALCRIKSDLRRIHHGHLEDIKDLMERAEPGKHLDLPGRIRIHKDRRRLTLRREQLPLRELGRREKGRKTLDKKGQTPRET